MDIEVLDNDAGAVLRISGDARCWNHPERENPMLDAASKVRDTGRNRLTIDLSRVHHIDSRGIGMLARVLTRLSTSEIAIQVVMPSGAAGYALRAVRIFQGCTEVPATTAS